MEYALAKAIEALCRCRANMSLTANVLSKKMAQEIVNDNDSVRAFFDGTKSDVTSFVGKTNTSVYSSYDSWCRDNGVEPLGKSNFSKKLCAHTGLSTMSSNGVRIYTTRAR